MANKILWTGPDFQDGKESFYDAWRRLFGTEWQTAQHDATLTQYDEGAEACYRFADGRTVEIVGAGMTWSIMVPAIGCHCGAVRRTDRRVSHDVRSLGHHPHCRRVRAVQRGARCLARIPGGVGP